MNDDDRPHPPLEELRSALGDHAEGLAATEALHASVTHEAPDAAQINEHADRLRSIPEAEAIVANWYESEAVQRFLLNLTNAGL
jgi:hypothetical protein